MQSTKTDVLVVGGGPGGFATAIALAERGLDVRVIDRTRATPRKGELLAPTALPVLGELGCEAAFRRSNHQPCPGIISSWGQATPREADFIRNPHGTGWFVDRDALGAMFEQRLAECGGATIRTASKAMPEHLGPHRWRVRVAGTEFRAPFLVYATGRSALVGNAQGRITIDEQVALLHAGTRSSTRGCQDLRLQVEATRDGWWYLALYPGGRVVLAFMTDADLLPKRPSERLRWLEAVDRSAPHIARRLGNCRFDDAPTVVSATTFLRKRVAGRDWLAVGDAAMGTDPLSGQGIVRALRSGLRASEAISRARGRPEGGLRHYALDTLAEFQRFTTARTANYRHEDRWPNSPYWARRLSPSPAFNRRRNGTR